MFFLLNLFWTFASFNFFRIFLVVTVRFRAAVFARNIVNSIDVLHVGTGGARD